ncbi:hypothetical protein L6164_013721 [Bauhinia variegata]|uniref:Uncharacterized protein n=1 Tax=Bauhinia variegata TaxID=167791 RepID=A0ACB9NF35_BAUVA|nr:hypothetical protein L6164_013721 [Bauhinia variegata]
MARSSSSFYCSLSLLFFLSLALSSDSTKTVKVEDICKQFQEDKTFCISFLNSKPGGVAGADLLSLGVYTMSATSTNLTNALGLIDSLLKNTTDHNLREIYLECQEQYEDLKDDVDSSKACFEHGRCYIDVNRLAGDVADAADDCSGHGDIPLPDTNPLKQESIVLGYVSEILIIITDFLMQK